MKANLVIIGVIVSATLLIIVALVLVGFYIIKRRKILEGKLFETESFLTPLP